MLDPAGHPFCLCDWSKELPANRKDPDHGPTCASLRPRRGTVNNLTDPKAVVAGSLLLNVQMFAGKGVA